MGSGGIGTGVGLVGIGLGIGSVGIGNGGCSGGTGISGGTLGGLSGPIFIFVLVLPTSPAWKEKGNITLGFVGQAVLVLECPADNEDDLVLSTAIMGNSALR